MSFNAQVWAREQVYPKAGQRVVMERLAEFCDGFNVARVQVQDLATSCRIPERSMRRYLAELVALGMIASRVRVVGQDGDTGSQYTEWVLAMPDDAHARRPTVPVEGFHSKPARLAATGQIGRHRPDWPGEQTGAPATPAHVAHTAATSGCLPLTATDITPYQLALNTGRESEGNQKPPAPAPDSAPTLAPAEWMWPIMQELGMASATHQLLPLRRTKLTALWTEHLKQLPAPQREPMFRRICLGIRSDEWWGKRPGAWLPDKCFNNPTNREAHVRRAIGLDSNGQEANGSRAGAGGSHASAGNGPAAAGSKYRTSWAEFPATSRGQQ